MNDIYDVVLLLIERLLPDGPEKYTLVEQVKKLQGETQTKRAAAVLEETNI